MAAVASILPTDFNNSNNNSTRHEELKIQAHHQGYVNHIHHEKKEKQVIIHQHEEEDEDDDDEEVDIVLLSPANTTSSSSSDDVTLCYPQTSQVQMISHDATTMTTSLPPTVAKDSEYLVIEDEAIMKSYLDPSPVPTTTVLKNRKKGPVLTRLKSILKKDDDDNGNNNNEEADTALSSSSSSSPPSPSPPPRSPSRSSNATLTTYTPQLDTSKIIDPSSATTSSQEPQHLQQNNNNNIRSMSSSSASTCSSTISSYSTVATSAISSKPRINQSHHDNMASPTYHPHPLHYPQHQQQPATRLSALAVHAAKRSEQYHFEHQQQHYHQQPSVRPMPTSSSRFKTALQMFRPNNNTQNGPGAQQQQHYHPYPASQGNISRNSIVPSTSEKLLHDEDDDEQPPTIAIVPTKSKSLAGRLKSKFQKKSNTKETTHRTRGSNMSRSTSLSSITSSWSRLTQSRSTDLSKHKKQQQQTRSPSMSTGISSQQYQSPQQHLSAIIQHQHDHDVSHTMYQPPTRHSMYGTPTPTSTTSEDHRPLFHVQQDQKRKLHHQHPQQQRYHYQQTNDLYRQQQHPVQYHRPQYQRFRQSQPHMDSSRPQTLTDPRLSLTVSPPPSANTSPIVVATAAEAMSGSIITKSNLTMTNTSSSGGRGMYGNSNNNNNNNSVRFAKVVSVRETYARHEYDRGSDPDAVCTRLTPAMAYFIKEELNTYKLHEMQVHECSRDNTHFFF